MSDVEENVPPEMFQTTLNSKKFVIPAKSEKKYQEAYNMFQEWRKIHNTMSCSESVLIAYFRFLLTQKKYAPNSLWAFYSMLTKTLNLNDNVDITNYSELKSFLRKTNVGYIPKKSKILIDSDIATFISAAPDSIHLLNKVVLVFGISGGLRIQELHDIQATDVAVKGNDTALVTIPNSTTNRSKSFAITGHFFELYAKYAKLRPSNTKVPNLFINYVNEKCTKQPVGINKIAKVPQIIAKFLNLPDPELYTGHSFRRSGVSLIHNLGAGIYTLKRVGGWDSDSVASQEENLHQNKLTTNELPTNTDVSPQGSLSTTSFNYRNFNEIADDDAALDFPVEARFPGEHNNKSDVHDRKDGVTLIKEEYIEGDEKKGEVDDEKKEEEEQEKPEEDEEGDDEEDSRSSFPPVEEIENNVEKSRNFFSANFDAAERMAKKRRHDAEQEQIETLTIDFPDDTMCSEKSRKCRRAEERHEAKIALLKKRHDQISDQMRFMRERHEADMRIKRLKALKLQKQLAAMV